jgi:hypothetical protein
MSAQNPSGDCVAASCIAKAGAGRYHNAGDANVVAELGKVRRQ